MLTPKPFRLHRELFHPEMASLFPLRLLVHTTIYKEKTGGKKRHEKKWKKMKAYGRQERRGGGGGGGGKEAEDKPCYSLTKSD